METQSSNDLEADRYAGQCAWCGEDVIAHDRDPSGDVIEWGVYTGEHLTFCTLFHVVQWFNTEYGEELSISADD